MKTAAHRRARRQQARRRGRMAEAMCRWHLRLRGWRIVASGWRCPSGEIDILARRRGVLAIVEVKSRGDLDSAADAVLPRQRRPSRGPPRPSCCRARTSPNWRRDST